MEEETTTDSTTTTGADEAQPGGAGADSAVTTDESTTTTTDDSQAAGAADDNLTFLQSKGVDLSTPEGQAKAAQSWREAEKAMHNSTTKASELQKALDKPTPGTSTEIQDDPVKNLTAEVQALKMTQSVTTFWATNPDAKAYEPAMTAIVTDNPTIGALVKSGYLQLNDLYQMARGADPKLTENLKTEGGREALQRVADKQQGKAVQGQATSSALGDEGKPDLFREGLLGKT